MLNFRFFYGIGSLNIQDIQSMLFLNFVLPLAFSIGLLLGIYIYMVIAELLILAGFQEAIAVPLGGWAALLLVVGVSIATVKRKVKAFEVSSQKAVIGHCMLAVGNIAAIATTIVPLSVSYLSGHTDYGLYMWFAIPVFFVDFILWPLGWKLATSGKHNV